MESSLKWTSEMGFWCMGSCSDKSGWKWHKRAEINPVPRTFPEIRPVTGAYCAPWQSEYFWVGFFVCFYIVLCLVRLNALSGPGRGSLGKTRLIESACLSSGQVYCPLLTGVRIGGLAVLKYADWQGADIVLRLRASGALGRGSL